MAQQCQLNEAAVLLPMIDARRMEVFTMPLDQNHTPLDETKAMIISTETIDELPQGKKVILVVVQKNAKLFLKEKIFNFAMILNTISQRYGSFDC